ncbi:preprotein translocase subunit SecA [bacterium]|jgi:preprotein translocase subunit SecA|nr:preprotein translocase subunit SecA [bacterium]MBT5015640.1 preprotein translocase subunit SecA [bacterium]
MITNLLTKVFGSANLRELKRLNPIVDTINSLEPTISALSDEDLANKTNEFRQQLSEGKTLDDILPEAFAVCREACKRKLGMRPYDVQLVGGIILHQGKIAEMKTGEGKTLTAVLPLYLNALTGKGVQLVTVNDYLARRDAEWNAPVYNFLGLSLAILQHDMNDGERKEAYKADILYATNNELGFDYLRDNMKFRLEDYVQRPLNYAIVDEIDSILIDEARTPLIISGSTDEESELYLVADKVIKKLKKEEDFEVDEKARSVQLTESGNDKVESALKIDNLYAVDNLKLLHHITQALKANALFRIDVDYVVRDGKVLIVDEFTGRILSGRRYSDGLHQALEAKEGAIIEKESQTLASITLQNYFRLYEKLAGMTGTATTEAEEFHKIYKLDVVSVPTHKPMIRDDKSDLIYLTKDAKYRAIAEDVKARFEKKQPVLIGTVAIETSELISKVLTRSGIPHEVLNAKQHEREADIVEYAGQPGRITIATNMAGRGTDIKLNQESKDMGGLYILGTERHESRRIDNQLRGRSGRQGDQGESRFYLSLEDELIRIFGGEQLKNRMQRLGMTEDEEIESRAVSKTIARAQEKVEKQNFETRKQLLEYDDVLNQHRTVIYQFRKEVLDSADNIHGHIQDMISRCVQNIMEKECPKRQMTPEIAQQVIKSLSQLTHMPVDLFNQAELRTSNSDSFQSDLVKFIITQYDLYRKQLNPELVDDAERWVILDAIDKAWKQHMLNVDHLKEGIGLRGYGQKNPLIEYKREAFIMFQDMMSNIIWEIIHTIFHMNIENFNKQEVEKQREKELEQMNVGGPTESANDPQSLNRAQRRAQKKR